jgi:hypothetical protein
MTTLAELKAEAARLNARIAELESGKAVPQSEPREGARVVALNNELTAGMPDLRQTEKLFNIVRPHSPWPQALVNKWDETKPLRGFSVALRWILNMQRTERPNGRVALSYYSDVCRTWLRKRNSVADHDVNSIVLAAFACGDVSYVVGDGQVGTVWELSLCEFGGRPADLGGWKRVLDTGNILAPSQPARRAPPPSPVRIFGG